MKQGKRWRVLRVAGAAPHRGHELYEVRSLGRAVRLHGPLDRKARRWLRAFFG